MPMIDRSEQRWAFLHVQNVVESWLAVRGPSGLHNIRASTLTESTARGS